MTDSEKLELLLSRTETMQKDMMYMKQNMADMKQDIGQDMADMKQDIGQDMADMKQSLQKEMADMKQNIGQDMADMKQDIGHDMADMRQDIKSIKLTIENEIRVNIQRIAEAHLDLSRNLHEAMKPNSEIEILSIKVGSLETKVRDLQQQIS